MKKFSFFILAIVVLFTSCSNPTTKEASERVAKGDNVYGGILRVNELEQNPVLYPTKITDLGSAHIATQIYEGLVKFNTQNLAIIPSLAEKWEIDEAGTTYTFHLKKGVLFHDNDCFENGKGREVKAADVIYSFKLLCTDSKDNAFFSTTFKDRVVGANKFFEDGKNGQDVGEVEGIKAVDDYTIKITLVSPSPSFLYALASAAASIVAKKGN